MFHLARFVPKGLDRDPDILIFNTYANVGAIDDLKIFGELPGTAPAAASTPTTTEAEGTA